NKILELEMSGILRYTHYSLMILGHNRIPIFSWMQYQASESLTHATAAGEMITHFGQHPSIKIADLNENKQHNINDILI
ncbi:bacterioferritin, partial [Francisella tularensis subsp. holarctica]|uniref:ferritin-like domain-containing protein n=1 Tax=Francisella tularensis TaxID=263 RepID=UPI002381C0EE